MDEAVPVLPVPVVKNRRPWLILFGVVELLLGAFLALLSILMMVALLFADRLPSSQATPAARAPMVAALLLFGVFAVVFVSVGIGTLLARRWARMMMLVVSTCWLLIGVFSMIAIAAVMPIITGQIRQQATTSPPAVGVVLGILAAFFVLFYLLLPASFLFFYTRRSVKAAFEAKERDASPTGRPPIPVLILSIWMGYVAVASLFGLITRVQILFGVLFTGVPAVLVILLMAGVYAWLARGLYRMQRSAWWGTVAVNVLSGVSGAVSYARVPIPRFIEVMQRAMPTQSNMPEVVRSLLQGWFPWTILAVHALFVGFMLLVGRYIPAGNNRKDLHPAETPDPI